MNDFELNVEIRDLLQRGKPRSAVNLLRIRGYALQDAQAIVECIAGCRIFTHRCATCGQPIDDVQARVSMARADGAHPACKDCVTAELTEEE